MLDARSMKPPVSLAITHFNRFEMIKECFAQVLRDQRVGEVVISDDSSNDGSYEKLWDTFGSNPKVRLYQNPQNVDCYWNKYLAVRRAVNDWVILFDSDNVITPAYLDALYKIPQWDPQVFYCPEFAEPHFDYTAFSGKVVDRKNVAEMIGKPKFDCAINTANYLVPRKGYLSVWNSQIEPHTADTLYMAYSWIREGGALAFVPGLRYFHRVHDGSHYKRNVHKTGNFAKQLETKLRHMK